MAYEHAIQTVFSTGNMLPHKKRVLLVGDSLMRQLFISIGCLAANITSNDGTPLLTKYEVDWQPQWPCHGTSNCVSAGVHSGFNVASLQFANGAELHFLPHSGSLVKTEATIVQRFSSQLFQNGNITFGPNTGLPIPNSFQALTENDTLVFNVGIHGPAMKKLNAFAKFGAHLLEQTKTSRPDLIYVTTPTQHFFTKDGQYDNITVRKGADCTSTVNHNVRRDLELVTLVPGTHVDHIVDYLDLEFGAHHVGGKDCSHYCMPGVPDWVAARLLVILQ